MNPMELVSLADSLREPDSVLDPDVRTNGTETLAARQDSIARYQLNESVPHAIRVHFETGKNLYLFAWFVYRFHPVAEQHVLGTLEFALRERLTAVLPAAEKQNWEKNPPGLRKLFKRAQVMGLISNEGLQMRERHALTAARDRVSREMADEMLAKGLESIEWDESQAVPLASDYRNDWLAILADGFPQIRNELAHGSRMLHASVLGTFTHVADLINQLYAPLPDVASRVCCPSPKSG